MNEVPNIIKIATPDGKIDATGMPFPSGTADVAEELEKIVIPELKADPPAESPTPPES